ncbi:cytochrome B [Pandoraea anapnoica]|uniref:Cytochrome B n=1 Tax=Pandoraea anapnoica TaxID=2508301 RepID=A0A5E5AQ05_9BURK|nr:MULTISPECIES: cytochrome b [Pandoraea]VVE59190.1 cytochrome B [Pandoraea iniqua]VVE75881.1 cytochrome B [Pandoraea anapnoica]
MQSTSSSAESAEVTRFAPPAIFFHWAVALLIVFAYAAIIAKGQLPRGSAQRDWAMSLHMWLGVGVLTLAVPRLLWRLVFGAPPALPGQSRSVRTAATMAHLMLYAFIFAQPILGYLANNAAGYTVDIPSLGVSLPALVAPNAALARSIKGIHETVGNLFYWVIGLHTLAALVHHYFYRDETLRRMI